MKELIHFAHGNGFPSLCYSQLLSRLAVRYDYCYIDKLGHNQMYPVTDNWPLLVTELTESIERQAQKPVIALGHSLGGVLSMLAAIERPELFKAVVLLDSPILGPFKSSMIKLAKSLGFIDRLSPAYRTKSRRRHWQTKEQVMAYLKTRDLFRTFSEPCLEDYIRYGLELKEDGYYLRFDRHVEYQIYRTLPHILPHYKGTLTTPTALIYGENSSVIDKMDLKYMKTHYNVKCFETAGTHLFPFEHPDSVANQIITVINAIL